MNSDKEKFQYRFDIDMRLFGEFNDTFCTINDHMGEIYGYSDLKDWEEIEYKRHIELLEKEVDKRIDIINGIENIIKEYCNSDDVEHVWCTGNEILDKIKKLKGVDKE